LGVESTYLWIEYQVIIVSGGHELKKEFKDWGFTTARDVGLSRDGLSKMLLR
jgi:hypothetical protein